MNLVNTIHFVAVPKLLRLNKKRPKMIVPRSQSEDSETSNTDSGATGENNDKETNNFTLFVKKMRRDQISDVYMTSGSEDQLVYQNK